MAKGKKTPASEPKAKKAEPTSKKVAKKKIEPVEKVKVAPKVEKPKKEKKAKVLKVVKAPPSNPNTPSKYAFPTKEECKHKETKRFLDRRLRVMHVCTNPACKKIIKFGSR